ncbi:hypothetical protein R6Q59_010886 [Mikania micrantha]
MAHHLQSLFILFLLANNHLLPAQTTQFNHGFLLKLTKDLESHQYTTQLLIGTPQLPAKVVVHLSDKSTWLNCPPSSPSRTFINRNSLQRLMAKSGDQKSASAICDVYQQNPITGVGVLAEDIVTVDVVGPISIVYKFLFSCSPESLLSGLVTGANGVLGFGRSKMAFLSQNVNNFDFPKKFIVCLSSSEGFIIPSTGMVGDVGAETRPEMRLIVVGAVMAMPMVEPSISARGSSFSYECEQFAAMLQTYADLSSEVVGCVRRALPSDLGGGGGCGQLFVMVVGDGFTFLP